MPVFICRGVADSSDESGEDSSNSNLEHYLPVTCTGRQPESDVFVFGPNIQLDKHGRTIPSNEQRYLWVPHILDKLHRVVNPLPMIPQSLHGNALQDVVMGIQQLTGENIYSGVFLLGE